MDIVFESSTDFKDFKQIVFSLQYTCMHLDSNYIKMD